MKNPNCLFRRASKFLVHELAAFSLVVFAAASLRADTPIQTENARLGTSTWQLTNPATNREIEGYASLTSVNRGEQISLYVNTSAATYTIEIYRMGWYGGDGGRLMVSPTTRNGIQQVIPSPTVDGLIDCNWMDPYVLSIPNTPDPTDWASGVYLAKLTAAGTGRQSYIIFVVRDDARPSDYLFQSSVTTFQAYNPWGGASLYNWAGGRGRAVKVSFNRPYALGAQASSASGVGAGEFLTNVQPPLSTVAAGWEYNMVRWLEREGLDVSYSTDVDTHENGGSLLQHKAFLSVGHDEYWSREMRTNVEAARDQIGNPVNLGFFSANTCYWRIRFEPSISTGASDRTIVCYRGDPDDPHANDDLATTKWELFPGRYPEASMIGVHFVYDSINSDVVVFDASHWACANTGLSNGDHLAGLLGYEIDKRDGDFSPAGTTVISQSHFSNRYHNDQDDVSEMTSYIAPSGATVFATGSIQWSWGLDDYNVRNSVRTSRFPPPLTAIKLAPQQITRNVLARFRNGSSAISPNPIDDARFFVRKQYHDFLSREPDLDGWDFWTNNITSCGSDAVCIEARRVDTSQAFFLSIEFQNTGYFVYRVHQAAFNTGETLLRQKFVSGSQQVGNGVVVGVGAWPDQLDQNKRAFTDAFVNNADFIAQYQQMSNSQYVDALNANTYDPQNPNSGGALTGSERDQLVADLDQSQKTRGQVLYAVAENSTFQQWQFNKAFVLMQYFGYLRRQPNEFPDSDFAGYGFWLRDLNQTNNAFELIRAFIESTEYRLRFGPGA